VAFYFDSGGLTAALLIAAGLHELGHVLASLLMGCRIEKLEFSAFGIAMEKEERGEFREALITAAGPLVNLFCWYIYGRGTYPFTFLSLLGQASLMLGIVNLLPACPLDGWRLVHLFLLKTLPFDVAEKISFWISVLSIFAAGLLGFFLLTIYRNPSLLAFSGFLCVYLIRQADPHS